MNDIPYNANPELVAMKQDLADRKFKIKMKGFMIVAALVAVGVIAAVGLASMGALPAIGGEAGKWLIQGAIGIGSTVVTLSTMKEVERLEMDEQYIESYMQGKNYWGEGYRKEVLEHGYEGPQVPFNAPPAPLSKQTGRNVQRR